MPKNILVPTINSNNFNTKIALFGACSVFLVYFITRNFGLYPFVFADEWIYSKASRLISFNETSIPYYVYYLVFRSTNVCGQGFLDCARILNAIFFVAASPFIYLVARQVSGKSLSLMVALLSLLQPVNSYTAYFMPEAFYFFSFAFLSWCALSFQHLTPLRYGVIIGCVLGVMTLIKVHTLFLMPALCVFMIYVVWDYRELGTSIKRSLVALAASIICFLIIRFGLGYLFAGSSGLHLFGSFYGDHAESLGAMKTLLNLLPAALVSLKGHLMSIVLLFAIPSLILVHYFLSFSFKTDPSKNRRGLYLYTILVLFAPLLMAVIYTASIAHLSATEGLRLHLRYYDFVFPLLFIVAISGWDTQFWKSTKKLNYVAGFAFFIGLVYSSVNLPLMYQPLIVDGPEIVFLTKSTPIFKALVGIELLIILVWIFNKKLGAQLFIFLFMPLCTLNTESNLFGYLKSMTTPSSFDKAGIFVRQYLASEDRRQLNIAGTGVTDLIRVQFHADHTNTNIMELADRSAIEISQLPGHKKWLLVVGQHQLPEEIKPEISNSDFSLVRIKTQHKHIGMVNFSKGKADNLLDKSEGLADLETWGSWSTGKHVYLHFKTALPRSLNIILKAGAFGPNVGQIFKLRIGPNEKTFRLGAAQNEVFLQLTTDGTQKLVAIEIPQPISPQELGLGNDPRKLGLALVSVEIGSFDLDSANP